MSLNLHKFMYFSVAKITDENIVILRKLKISCFPIFLIHKFFRDGLMRINRSVLRHSDQKLNLDTAIAFQVARLGVAFFLKDFSSSWALDNSSIYHYKELYFTCVCLICEENFTRIFSLFTKLCVQLSQSGFSVECTKIYRCYKYYWTQSIFPLYRLCGKTTVFFFLLKNEKFQLTEAHD